MAACVLMLILLTAVKAEQPVPPGTPNVMKLTLTSRQFVFEEGEARLLPFEDGRPLISETVAVAAIRKNVIEGITVGRLGEIHVMITNGVVRPVAGGPARLIPLFMVPADITKEDVRKGSADIPVGPAAFVRIRVRNQDGEPPVPPSVIGVIGVEPGTFEGPVNEAGEAEFLLRTGRYTAYVMSEQSRTETSLVVSEREQDVGIVELRTR